MQLASVYAQRDPRWSHVHLGTPLAAADSTIGAYGCYVSCFAMVATGFGHGITPAELNRVLADRQLFLLGNQVADATLAAAFPVLSYAGTHEYRRAPADLDLLRSLLADPATAVILELDFDHDPTDGIQSHFVVAVACDRQRVTVADPWYGAVDDLAVNYGSDPSSVIQKFVVYRGPIREESMTQEQRAILDKLAALGANDQSIDAWLSRIGRAAEIGRALSATKRMPRVVRPMLAELAAIAG